MIEHWLSYRFDLVWIQVSFVCVMFSMESCKKKLSKDIPHMRLWDLLTTFYSYHVDFLHKRHGGFHTEILYQFIFHFRSMANDILSSRALDHQEVISSYLLLTYQILSWHGSHLEIAGILLIKKIRLSLPHLK
jgi:hypothetical protein